MGSQTHVSPAAAPALVGYCGKAGSPSLPVGFPSPCPPPPPGVLAVEEPDVAEELEQGGR